MRTYCLEVWGDYACFTRPEMKTERVSYDVMTPSSARAIFDAILWKPAIRWQITKIEVMSPIKWITIRRNEISNIISTRNIKTAMKNGTGSLGLFIEDERQQRAGLFLRDVKYRIYAHFEILDKSENNLPGKFFDMFERRALKGQCINQPYLGCREFAAYYALRENQDVEILPINESKDLGWMLYDMDYSEIEDPIPRFFHAQLNNGVLTIPEWNSQEIKQ